jgi:putative transposase
MKVELQDERYTSQTCPACGKRHKPKNRIYKCSCGFQFHRDAVGSINIRRKYLECFDVPVVGAMASPIGVRYSAHLQCSPVFAPQSRTEKESLPFRAGENVNKEGKEVLIVRLDCLDQ